MVTHSVLTKDKVENINVADEFIEPFISLSGNSSNSCTSCRDKWRRTGVSNIQTSLTKATISIVSWFISSGCISIWEVIWINYQLFYDDKHWSCSKSLPSYFLKTYFTLFYMVGYLYPLTIAQIMRNVPCFWALHCVC